VKRFERAISVVAGCEGLNTCAKQERRGRGREGERESGREREKEEHGSWIIFKMERVKNRRKVQLRSCTHSLYNLNLSTATM
jgi:hypothetical protein